MQQNAQLDKDLYPVLKELQDRKALEHLVLIGGQAFNCYYYTFKESTLRPKSTTDADFLIPHPHRKIRGHVNIHDILTGMGFSERKTDWHHRILSYEKDKFDVEFIYPAFKESHGRTEPIPSLGINAVALNYHQGYSKYRMEVTYRDVRFFIPEPEAFLFVKYITSQGRNNIEKKMKDLDTAQSMALFVAASEERMSRLVVILNDTEVIPYAWKKKFFGIIEKQVPDFHKKVLLLDGEYAAKQHGEKTGKTFSAKELRALAQAEVALCKGHFEKYRERIYEAVLEGKDVSRMSLFVNHELTNQRRAKAKKTGKEKKTP